jgi:hypothetical protein
VWTVVDEYRMCRQKERDERRKKRKLDWLIHGGPRPEDTDDE